MPITGTPGDDIIDDQAGEKLTSAQTAADAAEARHDVEIAQNVTRSDVGLTNEEINEANKLRE